MKILPSAVAAIVVAAAVVGVTTPAPAQTSTAAPSEDDAGLKGRAVEALKFAVPLLAGLGDGPVQFDGLASFEMTLTGPGRPTEGQKTLEWFGDWSGNGKLSLDRDLVAMHRDLMSDRCHADGWKMGDGNHLIVEHAKRGAKRR